MNTNASQFVASLELRDAGIGSIGSNGVSLAFHLDPASYVDACMDAVELVKELEHDGYAILPSQDYDKWYAFVPLTTLTALVKVEAL